MGKKSDKMSTKQGAKVEKYKDNRPVPLAEVPINVDKSSRFNKIKNAIKRGKY